MSKPVLKSPLDAVVRDAIRDFMTRSGGHVKAICKAYRIDHRAYGRWLVPGATMTERVRERFLTLGRDVAKDGGAPALLRAGISELARDDDTNACVGAATRMAGDQRCAAALEVLCGAFDRVVALRSLESAAELLPQIVYTAYRFCPTDRACSALGSVARQVSARAPSRHGLGDDLTRGMAVSQLACALNEGAAAGAADELFGDAIVRRALSGRGSPRWLRPQLLRNRAHHMAWYGDGQGSLDRALAMVGDAADAGNGPQSPYSVAHSRCDLYLARGRYEDAWESIATSYQRVRERLVSCEYWCPSEGVSLMLAYSIYLSGTIARFATCGDGYAPDQQRDDLRTLGRWLDKLGGRVEAGHAAELPSDHRRLPAELRRIVLASRRAELTELQIGSLRELVGHLL